MQATDSPKRSFSSRLFSDGEVQSVRYVAKVLVGWTRVSKFMNELEARGKEMDSAVNWMADFDKILRKSERSRIRLQPHHAEVLKQTLRKGLCEKLKLKETALDNHLFQLAAKTPDLLPALQYIRDGDRDHEQVRVLEELSPQMPMAVRAFSKAFRDLHKEYNAFSNNAIDDKAGDLALEQAKNAEKNELHFEAAFWFSKAASAFRRQGRLFKAGECRGKAEHHLQVAFREARQSSEKTTLLHGLKLQLDFGRVHCEDFLNRGDFELALKHHEKLIEDAGMLLMRKIDRQFEAEITVRQLHSKRQKAEMLRYMGDYDRALSLIRSVKDAYPEAEYKAKLYSELCEADCLRMTGQSTAADSIYQRLENIAERDGNDGMLGAVLWRRASGLQFVDDAAQLLPLLKKIDDLLGVSGGVHKYFGIYVNLLKACEALRCSQSVDPYLSEAKRIGDLSELNRRTEFAHCLLIRGENLRTLGEKKASSELFRRSLELYRQMPMNWGMVRAAIGLQRAGENSNVCLKTLKGIDAEIWNRHLVQQELSPGELVRGLP